MLTCWHSAAAVEVQVGQRIAFVFLPVLGLWHLVTTRTRYLWKGHIHPGWYSAAIEESLGIKLSQDTFVICEQHILGTADKWCSQAYFELTLLSLSSVGATRNPARVPGIAARHASLLCRVGTQPRKAYLQAGMPWHNWKRASLGNKYGLGAINISFWINPVLLWLHCALGECECYKHPFTFSVQAAEKASGWMKRGICLLWQRSIGTA